MHNRVQNDSEPCEAKKTQPRSNMWFFAFTLEQASVEINFHNTMTDE